MRTEKTITLLEPFEHHGQTLSSITLREPTAHLFAELGEPRIWVRNAGGGYWVEQPGIVRQYLDRSIVHQDGTELLKLMGLADSMQLKDELIGFFVAAEALIISKKLTSSASAN